MARQQGQGEGAPQQPDWTRIDVGSLGRPSWLTIVGHQKSDPNHQEYLKWVGIEQAALQSAMLMERTNQRQPIRLWRVGDSGEIATVQDLNQLAFVQVQVYLEARQSIDIPLLDSEDRPLICPARLGMIETRYSTSSADEVGTNGRATTWRDQYTDFRSTEEWPHDDGPCVTVSARLARDPRPHVALTITNGAVQKSDGSAFAGRPLTVVASMLGVGGNAPAEYYRADGTASVSGHYQIHRWWNHLDPFTRVTSSAFDSVQFAVHAVDVLTSGGTQRLYMSDTGLGPLPAVGLYASLANVPIPIARVRAISAPGAAATLSDRKTWVQDTRHRCGYTIVSPATQPPVAITNLALGAYRSVMAWDGTNGKWYVDVTNDGAFNRSFGVWSAGVSA